VKKILDKMFENKRLSVLIPIFISSLLYFLFVFFGTGENKVNLLIVTPIISVLWFFGSFFVVYFQVKNKNCPESFLNFLELSATFIFVLYSVFGAVSVVLSGFQDFSPITCAGMLTYASMALAHGKRTDQGVD